MGPFKTKPRRKNMMKLTLTDGQEFTGKASGDVGASSWVQIDIGTEIIYYPLHRIRDVRTWSEVE